MLFIGIVFTLVPAVSASPVNAGNSGKEVNKPTAEISYIVLPAEGSSLDNGDPRIYPLTTVGISQGGSRKTYLPIGPKVNSIEVDLKWPAGNILSLNILDPKNVNLGTYYDNADGRTDQRIHLFIYPSKGTTYITQGTWTFTVKGESVSGTISFSIMCYTR